MIGSTARACILSVSGLTLTAAEATFLSDAQPWGVILMGRSCGTPEQVRHLVDSIWGALGRPCLIFIDQEGGRVRRLRPPNWPEYPAAGRYGKLYESEGTMGAEACYLGHRLMAEDLSSIGIHADCAPVLDVPAPGSHSVIGDRAFAESVEAVATLGRAALQGLADGGVAGVIKHMPGHGRSQADSHHELPVVAAGDNALATDLAPFIALAQEASMGMTAHIAYDSIDPGVPATLSKKVIEEIIRGRIGFDGLLMTDDLGMQALGGTLDARATRAWDAGCDIVLHCAGFTKEPKLILAEMEQVVSVAPWISDATAERVARAEQAATQKKPLEANMDRAHFDTMMAIGARA